ncbi:Holliday junction resolvase RuvX [Aeromicrobium sp. CTD01-1L150]|uniref:Holliday junction resolvase RuvX n=1 Tax=Aeromicrobium sp. CTD01-1L150 TaxID=3341830 RepID=UPI0035BFD05B
MRRGRRLGVDVGSVRIGVAVCDPDGLVATPLETVAAGDGAVGRLAELAEEVSAIEFVVGLPVSLNGRESHAATTVRAFVETLRHAVPDVGIRLHDERMSTMSADSLLREGGRSGRSRREVIDQAAATVILQAALDAERTRGVPPGETI